MSGMTGLPWRSARNCSARQMEEVKEPGVRIARTECAWLIALSISAVQFGAAVRRLRRHRGLVGSGRSGGAGPPQAGSLPHERISDVTMAESKAQYSAIVLGATGNVGGRIVQLLIKSQLCKKVVVVTRRKTDAFAGPKVSEVVVNMDRLGEEVRKIEIAHPQAFCRAAKLEVLVCAGS